jgi:hypothetical protein
MPNSPSNPNSYTLEKLLALIAESPAYAQLPEQEKAKIQEHVKLNNKLVLIYIYQKLSEENSSLDISRENLAKKILTLKPSDRQNLHDDLRQL